MGYVSEIEAYQNLANAIVKCAADDYRAALRGLMRQPTNTHYREEAQRIEKFFRSEWYELLTNVDGEYLIERLRKDEKEREAEREKKRKEKRQEAKSDEHNVELSEQRKCNN